MALLLSTTGVQDPVVLNDLGQRTFSHPTTNLNLELEYPLWELLASSDLFSALSSGWITLTFDGASVSTSQFTELARGNMQTFTYDTDGNGIVDNAATSGYAGHLNGQSGSFYLDRANHTGTQTASTISDFNSAAQAAVMLVSGTSGYSMFSGTAGWATSAAFAYNALDLNGQPDTYYLNRANHNGTQTVSTISDLATNGTSGWAVNAANAYDLNGQPGSYYLNRTNHTGTQTASTISDFYTAMLSGTSGYAFNASHAIDASTLNSQAPSFYLNRANHTGTQTVSTISDLATNGTAGWATNSANAFDLNGQPGSYYLNRANHTGTQTASTISDFYTAMLSGTSGYATAAGNAFNLGGQPSTYYLNTNSSIDALKDVDTTTNAPHVTNLLNWSTSGTAGVGNWTPIDAKSVAVRNSWILSAGVNAAKATNRFCNWTDGAAMNLNGYVVPTNATINYITASTNASATWTPSVYVNGSVAITLSISAATTGRSGLLSYNVNAGDIITLYINGSSISRPAISVHFYER